ncbi:ATP synthase peripheral stalk subunit d, mitochondrial-like [Chelonoidis abingdonii]|uniref:ATP synthase peripheral stalk subunit d, mitochondrial-like n=1 Tax=Chelonoidis abingdonii TaxID=106734 RepID=UPI003F4979B0
MVLTSLPEKPPSPAIDWVYYKTAVAKAGIVDEFERKYNALKLHCQKQSRINVLTKSFVLLQAKIAAEYAQASKSRIVQSLERELEKFITMIPFDQMTFEDLNKVFPETKLDKEKYPYWPHKPIEDL